MLFQFLATLILIRTNANYCYELCASGMAPGMGVSMVPNMMNQQMAICNCTPIGTGGVPGMFQPPGTMPGMPGMNYPGMPSSNIQQPPEYETITQCHTQVHTDCSTKVIPKFGPGSSTEMGIDNGLFQGGQTPQTGKIAMPSVGVSNCIPMSGQLGFVGIQTPQQVGGVCVCPPTTGAPSKQMQQPTTLPGITNQGGLLGNGKFAENFCVDGNSTGGISGMITDCVQRPNQPSGVKIGDSIYPAINRSNLGSWCPPC